jgi:hypothetical protein
VPPRNRGLGAGADGHISSLIPLAADPASGRGGARWVRDSGAACTSRGLFYAALRRSDDCLAFAERTFDGAHGNRPRAVNPTVVGPHLTFGSACESVVQRDDRHSLS